MPVGRLSGRRTSGGEMQASDLGAVSAGVGELVLAVDHVGIAVEDFEAAVALWGTFGLTVVHEEVNDDQGVREAMLAAGGGSTRIQILAPTSADSPIARFLDRSGPGIQQVALRVRNVEAAAAALRTAGFRLLYDTARVGTAGSLVNFVHPKDCGGVLVELVEPIVGNHP